MQEQASGALGNAAPALDPPQPPQPTTGTPVSEEPRDQVGEQLTLREALRPARRLPWGLLCTSTLSSSDLREAEGLSTAGRPTVQGLGPRKRVRPGWGKTGFLGH